MVNRNMNEETRVAEGKKLLYKALESISELDNQNGESEEDPFPYDVYDTMNTAREQFLKIDFPEKVVLILEYLCTKESLEDYMKEISLQMDSITEDYKKAIESENCGKHMYEYLEILEKNKKSFIDSLKALYFVSKVLTT